MKFTRSTLIIVDWTELSSELLTWSKNKQKLVSWRFFLNFKHFSQIGWSFQLLLPRNLFFVVDIKQTFFNQSILLVVFLGSKLSLNFDIPVLCFDCDRLNSDQFTKISFVNFQFEMSQNEGWKLGFPIKLRFFQYGLL